MTFQLLCCEFAKEVVVETTNMAPVQAEVAPIPETPRQSTATVVVEGATEAPVATASDSEWEQVTEQDRTSAPVVVEPVAAGPVVVAAPSASEGGASIDIVSI